MQVLGLGSLVSLEFPGKWVELTSKPNTDVPRLSLSHRALHSPPTVHIPVSKLALFHSFILCPYCWQRPYCLVDCGLPISPKWLWTSWVWGLCFVSRSPRRTPGRLEVLGHVLKKYWALSVVQEAGWQEIRCLSSLPWWRIQSWVGDRFSKLPNYTCEQLLWRPGARGFMSLPSGLISRHEKPPMPLSHVQGERGGQGYSLGESWLMALAPWDQSGQWGLRSSLEERETSVLWSLCSCWSVISWVGVTSQPPVPSRKHRTC